MPSKMKSKITSLLSKKSKKDRADQKLPDIEGLSLNSSCDKTPIPPSQTPENKEPTARTPNHSKTDVNKPEEKPDKYSNDEIDCDSNVDTFEIEDDLFEYNSDGGIIFETDTTPNTKKTHSEALDKLPTPQEREAFLKEHLAPLRTLPPLSAYHPG